MGSDIIVSNVPLPKRFTETRQSFLYRSTLFESLMILTHEMLQDAKTPAGGYNKAQLAILGIEWPPKKGWPRKLVGKEVSEELWSQFVALSEKHHKRNPEIIEKSAEYRRGYADAMKEMSSLQFKMLAELKKSLGF